MLRIIHMNEPVHPEPKTSFISDVIAHLNDGEEIIKIDRRITEIKAQFAKEMRFDTGCDWSLIKLLAIEAGERNSRKVYLLNERRFRQMGAK